jgi:hypothetical protein
VTKAGRVRPNGFDVPRIAVLAVVMIGAGLIAPVPGALLQEAIDVAVIVNALRSSRSPRTDPRRESADTISDLSRQIPQPWEATLPV